MDKQTETIKEPLEPITEVEEKAVTISEKIQETRKELDEEELIAKWKQQDEMDGEELISGWKQPEKEIESENIENKENNEEKEELKEMIKKLTRKMNKLTIKLTKMEKSQHDSNNTQPRKYIECYNCGKKGHISKECRGSIKRNKYGNNNYLNKNNNCRNYNCCNQNNHDDNRNKEQKHYHRFRKTTGKVKGREYVHRNTKDENGKDFVIEFASQSIGNTKKNYNATELELNATIWAMEKFYYYLGYSHFILITDHSAMTYLKNNPIKELKG
ncbi:hypothetical protein Glove_110g100 [Diversispora epigaea]|uniref:CCHC-type domain-containing protein n=1 Tax=Diversispora epigaea TaxID=1348612 RepID=A0A397J641_9GLOM|nr:hypothetical protein Glove_110g100 [Diversispora epigaea]